MSELGRASVWVREEVNEWMCEGERDRESVRE